MCQTLFQALGKTAVKEGDKNADNCPYEADGVAQPISRNKQAKSTVC